MFDKLKYAKQRDGFTSHCGDQHKYSYSHIPRAQEYLYLMSDAAHL